MLLTVFLLGCSKEQFNTNAEIIDDSVEEQQELILPMPTDEKDIKLDTAGEQFQSANKSRITGSRYMEKNCTDVTAWSNWKNFPMKRCSYTLLGSPAKVLMLNPGPRRLTQWLQNACRELAKNYSTCMSKSLNQMVNQSGFQFPVAGVVLENLNGNNRAESYAFRNGVSVIISSFMNTTEALLTAQQIEDSFTDEVIYTYRYGRPISVTREQITKYAQYENLIIPTLGSSDSLSNVYNEVLGDLYRKAWHSNKNHIIRAWIYNQKF